MKKQNTALNELRKYSFKVILAPLLKLIEVATELFMPFLIRYILDEGLNGSNIELTLIYGGIMIAIAFVGFGITMIAQYLAAMVSSDFGRDLRAKLFEKATSLSEEQLNKIGKGKILNLISNDSMYLQTGVMMFMRLIFRPPFLLLGASVFSFIIDWRAGIIFVSTTILSAVVLLFVMFKSPKFYSKIQNEMDNIVTISSDSINGIKPIKAFGKEEEQIDKFKDVSKQYKNKSVSVITLNSFINPLTFCFVNLAMVLVVYIGQISLSDPDFSIGKLVSLISYLVTSLAALVMFSRMIVSVNKALASRKRIDEFLAYESSIKNNPKDTKIVAPFIKFDNVSFSYSKSAEKKTIESISFEVEKGQTLGVIGGTGSGKSTIVSLLSRIYDVDQGDILIDGKNIKDYDIRELRKMISISPQKPSLFKGSVKENIILSKEVDEEKLNKAIIDSLSKEFIDKFDEGIDHLIEEGGSNLSGGQRQRILIARALYHKSQILILDDSTSALDYISDKKVRDAISSYKDLTKIIISQRVTSLKDCDLILVIDEGKIVGRGKHDELMRSSSIYKEIYDMQVATR